MTRESFIRYFLAFNITPIPLAIFPEIYEMWSFQHNLLSIITPRNFVLEFSLIDSPSILVYTFGSALFLLENIMKWVFLIFRDSLFAFNHKEISFNSSFNVFIIKSLSLPLMNRLLSSANSIGNVFLHTVAWSFIYMRNKSGPNIDPCGTPHFMTWFWDFIPL